MGATPLASSLDKPNSFRKFLLSRLHSLAGIIPLGLFLLEHFYSNAVAMLGAQSYDNHIQKLLGIPFLPVIEVLFIAIPLLYHAVFGLYLAFLSKNNSLSYSYPRNWKFALQRLSGVITLIFVIYHVWSFRISSLIYGTEVNYQLVQEHLMNPFILVFYVLGVLSTTFHFTNGLWAGLITWGVTVSPNAQRISAKIAFGLFIILSACGIITLASF
jgi:succinate dehydrogenase / fumarate reductase cytochrome b subunit